MAIYIKRTFFAILAAVSLPLTLIWVAREYYQVQIAECVLCKTQVSTHGHREADKRMEENFSLDQEYDFSQCKKKRILIYTELFGRKIWPNVPGDYNFTELTGSSCEVSHCEVTYDHSQLNTSDVVFAHGRDLPPAKDMLRIREELRNPEQIWVYFIHESPRFVYYDVAEYNGVFNWTASYRLASEVFIPYYTISRKTQKSGLFRNINYSAGRDKMVLYVSSHCDDVRLSFIKNLQKWTEVDVYGSCSTKIHGEHRICEKDSELCQRLQKRYRFYLAFENSHCIDYITEKYFKNSLLQGLVPIVVGGANYSNPLLAVPNSFVDASKFDSMENLAKYLTFLQNTPAAYNEYFAWKQSYQVELKHGMCKLCAAVWDENTPKTRKTVDLKHFWGAEGNCYDPHERLKKLLE